jgi:cellulose synthase/poly-beta-1,6-N-acetylglucosamine synthase-like glycosyltransferase
MNNITISRFSDYRPDERVKYFSTEPKEGCMSVIVPFYNEEKNELQVTLKSLHKGFSYLGKMKKEWNDSGLMRIIIIQDGWYKASESMKQYLKELFPKKIEGEYWWNYHKEFIKYDINRDGTATFIFESEVPICINKEEDDKIFCYITMLIKVDNRKKHNSHEWFIGRGGFSEYVKSKYLFCTDAFTIFHKACLYHLVNHLDNNPKSSVATGRQRVMTRKQQGTDESLISLGTVLRMVQLFDFETSNTLYNGAFSLGGCLPVIPGPCGLYRSSDMLQNQVRDWYFDIVNQEPSQTGLVLGNLRIAEDRILSYSAVLKTEEERNMAFVPMAVFYFEAETDLKMFILQRRRWINGSVAGYVYLLFSKFEHIRDWNVNIVRKLYIWMLLLCQFITYFLVSIGPAFSISIFYYSFKYVLSGFIGNNFLGIEAMTIMATTLAWILFSSHMLVHNRDKFHFIIIYSLLGFSFITSILTFLAMVFFVLSRQSISGFFLYQVLFGGNIIVYLILLVTIMPFILALLISGRGHSFFYMLKGYFFYFIFSHMLISAFGSYSFARTWDLTWGNRPTSEIESHGKNTNNMDKIKLKFRIMTKGSVFIILGLNLIVFFLPKTIQVSIVGLFFLVAFIQLFFSFIYLCSKIPAKLNYVFNYWCHKQIKNEEELKYEIEMIDEESLQIAIPEIVVDKRISEINVHYTDNENTITITTDTHPYQGYKYFEQKPKKDSLSVVVPFYNEERRELQITLNSLYENHKYTQKMLNQWKDKSMKIVIIQDGWYKASESMQDYLMELFPDKINSQDWWEYFDDFENYKPDVGSKTYIFESKDKICINPNEENLKFMDITLIIKIDNRKKHNSHEWFMGKSGFGEYIEAKYLYCTDAGTVFNKSCLYHMIDYMDRNSNISVSTGRARVMSKEQQGSNESWFSLASVLRQAQKFEFENVNAVYNGAFNLGGCLPVIPGPCGLYRASDILQNRARDWYFDIVNKEPSQTGLVLGNLRIAEDRILSYSVILKTEEERKMAFIPLSIFYFEAELKLQNLLLQRRRWINGSIAGYIYLLFTNPEHLLRWKTNIFRKSYVLMLLLCQFITFCIVSLGPAFSISMFSFSIHYVFYESGIEEFETYTTIATIGAWVLFITHIFVHNKDRFHYTLIYCLLGFSFITTTLFLYTLGSYLYKILSTTSLSSVMINLAESGNLIIYLILFVTIMPFILALFVSGKGHSFFYMIKGFPSYLLFSHMLISAFGSYSFSRTWDLTWGNRPNSVVETNNNLMQTIKERFSILSKTSILFILVINAIVFFLPIDYKIGIIGLFFFLAFVQLSFSFIDILLKIPLKIRFVFKKCIVKLKSFSATNQLPSTTDTSISIETNTYGINRKM